MFKAAAFLLLSFSVVSAHAKLNLIPDVASQAGDIRDYQLGSEWGKKRVTVDTIRVASPVFKRAAQATVELPIGGTGFYLGKFADQHVIATNHHVCPAARDCVGDVATLRLINKKFRVSKFLITLPEVDLTLLTLEVARGDEKALLAVAQNFAFKKSVSKGAELTTVGFGIGGNGNNSMMANQDADCKVFSKNAEYKLLADPDEFNPALYKAWSFAHGCDISHGDSGSAIVEKRSGDIVGILWTGKIPKAKSVQSSETLKKMFDSSDPAIWRELSYGVPSVKIAQYLKKQSANARLDEATKNVFKEMLK